MNNNVQKLGGYGTGYAFSSGEDINLSKFDVNAGYNFYVEHYGFLDPLIGDLEGPYWYDYKDTVKFVIESLNKTNDWLSWLNTTYNKSFTIIDEAISWVLDDVDSAEEMIAWSPVLNIRTAKEGGTSIFGVTDIDYFMNIVKGYIKNRFGFDDDDIAEYLNVSEDGDLVLSI